jgi:spermidine/putrescine transport system substrate-binding protein
MTKNRKPSRRIVLKGLGALAGTSALSTPYLNRAWAADPVEINMLAWYGHGEPDMVEEFEPGHL